MISRRGAAGGLAAALIVAALAVVPTIASAAPTSVLPGTKKTEWARVNCSVVSTSKACNETPFQMVSTHRFLRHNGEPIFNCEEELEGHFEANGTTKVTSGSVTGPGLCEFITLNFKKEWPGEICEWKKPKKAAEHQMWDRLEVHFQVVALGIELNGPLYIHLQTAAGGDGDPLAIGQALAPTSEIGDPISTGWTYTATGEVGSESTPYVFTVSEAFPQLRVASNEETCKWAELK